MKESQQRLYIRMYHRKGPWFKMNSIVYKEIPDTSLQCDALVSNDFALYLNENNSTDISFDQMEEILNLMNVSELKSILKFGNWKATSNPLEKGKKGNSLMRSNSINNHIGKDQMLRTILLNKNQRGMNGQLVLPKLIWKTLGKDMNLIRLSAIPLKIFDRIKKLYFLNERDDHSLLILSQMEKVSFPKYSIRKVNPIFANREDLLGWEQATILQNQFEILKELGDNESALSILNSAAKWLLFVSNPRLDPFYLVKLESKEEKREKAESTLRDDFEEKKLKFLEPSEIGGFFPHLADQNELECLKENKNYNQMKELVDKKPYLARFSIGWIFSRMLWYGVDFLERLRNYEMAVLYLRILLSTPFCPGRRGNWWNRLALDVEHLKKKNTSLILAEVGHKDKLVRTASRQGLQKRILKLAKPPRRLKIPQFLESKLKEPEEITIYGKLLNYSTGTKSKFLSINGEAVTVEGFALEYYAKEEEWTGIHSENEIFKTLFGIFMWDILFAPVDDVFQTPFQGNSSFVLQIILLTK